MQSPKLSVNIVESSFLCGSFQEGNGDDQEEMGGYLEVDSLPTLAVQDAVETAAVVAVAEEVAAEVPVQPCIGRNLRLVPAMI